MDKVIKPINAAKEEFHLAAESRVHTFSYRSPEKLSLVKEMVNMVRTPNVRVQVQIVSEGGENNLHYHVNSDGVWMVLKGECKFYGPGDKLIGDLKEMDGIVLPGGARYWFETTGDVPLEILHITAVENSKQIDQRINIEKHKDWMTDSVLQVYEDDRRTTLSSDK